MSDQSQPTHVYVVMEYDYMDERCRYYPIAYFLSKRKAEHMAKKSPYRKVVAGELMDATYDEYADSPHRVLVNPNY